MSMSMSMSSRLLKRFSGTASCAHARSAAEGAISLRKPSVPSIGPGEIELMRTPLPAPFERQHARELVDTGLLRGRCRSSP